MEPLGQGTPEALFNECVAIIDVERLSRITVIEHPQLSTGIGSRTAERNSRPPPVAKKAAQIDARKPEIDPRLTAVWPPYCGTRYSQPRDRVRPSAVRHSDHSRCARRGT